MPNQAFVVIPAFNEAGRVGEVIKAAQQAHQSLVNPEWVTVINNNSTDSTAEEALRLGADVVNCDLQGKGWAMKCGADHVREIGAQAVLFLDADLRGLTGDHVTKLAEPVIDEEALMTIGYLGGRTSLMKRRYQNWGAFCGQRCVSWEAWDALSDPYDFIGWRTEAALNTVFRRANRGNEIRRIELPGVTHIGKRVKKENDWPLQYARMYLSAANGLLSSSSL